MEETDARILHLDAEFDRISEERRAAYQLRESERENRNPNWHDRDMMSERSPPLVFLAVCRQWRHLAMGHPVLWSTLRVRPSSLNDIGMMIRWLQFAHQQPLTIQLFAGDDWEIADLALDVLMEHQACWFHIELIWEMHEIAPLLAHEFAPAHHAPLLQTFRIFTNLADSPNLENAVDARLGKLLSGSPALHLFEWSYELSCTSPASPIHLPNVPFSNLHHLRLGCQMEFSCCIEIMRQMPLLETCDLLNVWDGFGDHDHTTASALRLQHLHSLCIKTDGDMSSFLDKLVLPALRRLEVVFRLYNPDQRDGSVDDERRDVFDPWPHAEFLSFLQRSACPLEELDLVTSVDESELLQYLPIVSSTLHTLSLRGKLGWTCIDHRALSLLTIIPGGSRTVLCPNLRTIRLEDCIKKAELPNGSVANMVQSRLILAAASRNQQPLDFYLAAPNDFLDWEDWRRLYVLSKRSAGRLKISLHELPDRLASE
ncbi:hypothetical protein HWV62_36865 [Athelia sp. TMB]|nr:hypothetical protein HWV62_36865 [Athelia sp. TMB]